MTTTTYPKAEGFEPFSREYLADPHAALQGALRDTPVSYYPPLDAFVVLRYGDVQRILHDFETFSSDAYKTMPVSEPCVLESRRSTSAPAR